ncbi:MAG: Efflux ABC transporter, ATP-binding protein [uncultured Thermomicrobiales bacterium]|uniref:Efflux ABC transporter, ATP-binding protein n=1 Tax=uncultured Thermomicrobiales bacterium TaxID=1645740 RepID=A0A6J4VDT1_9BACT|nr:MAG: Efflux ABC transporter, ATP-binding protein [uncultured Thermomicrobiales bacterium]
MIAAPTEQRTTGTAATPNGVASGVTNGVVTPDGTPPGAPPDTIVSGGEVAGRRAPAPTTRRANGGAAAADLAIEAVQLERRFGDFVAVDKVDLAVRRGEIYGFLGPNGAGKSTTTRMLCTLTAPTGGRAIVAGHDVASDPDAVRLRIGVALQSAALDDKQTGAELLRQQGRYYGLTRAEIDRRLEDMRTLVDLGDALDQRIKSYSGGMKRRIDLAAALIHNPEVLFLDEPTTGLDPVSRAKVWEEVRRLNTDLGMTIFLTTQYLEEADSLADRVGVIDHGRIVAEGTPEALKRSIGSDVVIVRVDDVEAARRAVAALPGVDAVEVHGDELTASTSDGPGTVSPVAVALAEADVRVHALTLREPTLDDVFLTLTGNRLQEEDL